MYKFLIFNVFLLRQAHLHSKVKKQANFCGYLQNSQSEIKNCRIILQGPVQKQCKIESPFFEAMLFGLGTSKKYFMFTLKKSNFDDINPL